MSTAARDGRRRIGGVYISMREPVLRGVLCTTVLLLAGASAPLAVQGPGPSASRPVEPIEAIVEAARSHAVVALGDDHGNEQGHAFRLALIRDPRFAGMIDDIVVEFGNARYQELMDRFVRGETVADDALRHVWQDTTAISGVWDRPIYEDFFRAMRAVNAATPGGHQLRVILGDLPVDWEAARRSPPTPGERRLYGQPVPADAPEGSMDRERHAASLIQRETLAKGRRALIIFGDQHLTRRRTSIVGRLERDAGTRVFTIANASGRHYDALMSLQPDVLSWRAPSLAMVADTILAPSELGDFDALLYLGPPSAITRSKLPASLCNDAGYAAMRRERMALAGVPPAQADNLMSRDCPARATK